jgi:hypothetical protein
MDDTAATHILLDPNSSPDARVLYVAGFGRGVYKSIDSGKTWSLKNQGITQKQPFAWRLSQASDGTLYLVLARRSEDGSIGNANDGALYRSKDGAEHWELVALPKDVNGQMLLLWIQSLRSGCIFPHGPALQGRTVTAEVSTFPKTAVGIGGRFSTAIGTFTTSPSIPTIRMLSMLRVSNPRRGARPIAGSTGPEFPVSISSGRTG